MNCKFYIRRQTSDSVIIHHSKINATVSMTDIGFVNHVTYFFVQMFQSNTLPPSTGWTHNHGDSTFLRNFGTNHITWCKNLKDCNQMYSSYENLKTCNDGPSSYFFVNKISPVTGLEWPRGFQEVKVPRLHDNGTGWW